ncbi:MAG TPA: EamA family transporter [Glycomyces sp.]|nr:EamA family transporter [Glycomyces sp.]
MRRRNDRVGVALFVAASILAGGNAVGVRFSNRELDPLWGASARFGAAAVILLAIMAVRGLPMPRGRPLAGTVLFGMLNFAVPFALAYYALVHIHAGLGQTLLSLVPLVTLLLSAAQHQERFRSSLLVGTVLAVTGVAVIAQAPLRGDVPLPALLAVLGAVLSFAQASILVHRLPKTNPVTMNAVGMTAAALALLVGSIAVGDQWVLPERAETWWAIAYLVVGGSVLTFILYVQLIARWGPSRSSYAFVVIPVVTIMLSAWLDDEPLTWSLLAGAPLILLGVYFGALRHPRKHVVPEEPAS